VVFPEVLLSVFAVGDETPALDRPLLAVGPVGEGTTQADNAVPVPLDKTDADYRYSLTPLLFFHFRVIFSVLTVCILGRKSCVAVIVTLTLHVVSICKNKLMLPFTAVVVHIHVRFQRPFSSLPGGFNHFRLQQQYLFLRAGWIPILMHSQKCQNIPSLQDDCQYYFGCHMPSCLIKNKFNKFIMRYNCVENDFCKYG